MAVTVILVSIVCSLLTFVYLYLTWIYTYWNRKGIIHLKGTVPFGNLRNTKESYAETMKRVYFELKEKEAKHGGFYVLNTPVWMPLDPELIKHVIQKDFNHFMNHGLYFNEDLDPLSGHLFNLEDTKWKNLRAKLTPTFTSGKMKMMFDTMKACTIPLENFLEEAAKNKKTIDTSDILGRFTTDVIMSCAFGIDCNSVKNPDSEFRKYGKMVFEDNRWLLLLAQVLPKQILDTFKFKTIKKPVDEFFRGIVQKTVTYRETNNIYRKDFMHLLIQLKNMGKVSDDANLKRNNLQEGSISMNELAAQAYVFFIAGFETSSTLQNFAIFELATNQNIQDKLRKEIRDVLKKHNNEMSYDSLMEMTYLDRILEETLRMYPPVAFLPRVCNKDFRVPGTDKVIKAGTQVSIPNWGLHMDEDYYPNPEVFDPERFTEENKVTRPKYTWLPFGEGPRLCIGLRFGLMQAKAGIISFIRNYKITMKNQPRKPIKMDNDAITTTPSERFYINVTKVE